MFVRDAKHNGIMRLATVAVCRLLLGNVAPILRMNCAGNFFRKVEKLS